MKQTPWDHFNKQLLDLVLSPIGATVTDAVIPAPDDQRADVVHVPDPKARERQRDLGVLGDIAAEPCQIEPFRDPPDGEAFVHCLRKFLNLRQHETVVAKREGRGPHDFTLWILCAGDPVTLRGQLKCVRAGGWPRGVWRVLLPVRVCLVVIAKLPETSATLVLRLMGNDRVSVRARAELMASPQRQSVMRDLRALVVQFVRQQRLVQKEDPAMAVDLSLYYQWEREAIAKGEEKGLRPLIHQFERRLGRVLREEERSRVSARMSTLGADRLGDVVLDLTPEQLAAWLADPDAR